jgi:hypothetical protein
MTSGLTRICWVSGSQDMVPYFPVMCVLANRLPSAVQLPDHHGSPIPNVRYGNRKGKVGAKVGAK